MEDHDFDLRAVVGVLGRQWKLIAVTVLVVLGLSTLGVFALKPVYTSSVLVLMDPNAKNLLNPGQSTSNASTDSARVDSEVQIVTAETILQKVVGDANLVQEPSFAPSVALRDRILIFLRLAQAQNPTSEEILKSAVSKLRSSVKVARSGLTYLIVISATAEAPALAAKIANTLANDYIEGQVQSKIASVMASRDIIDKRVADASSTVSQSESALNDFIVNSVAQIVAETGRTDLAQMQQQLKQLADSKSSLDNAIQLAESSLSTQDFASLAETLKSETLASLEKQREELERQLKNSAAGSPQDADLRAQLAAVVADLQNGANREISSLRDQVSSAQARAADMQVQLRTALINSDLPPSILTNLYALQQTAVLARTQYQTLLTRQSELDAQAFLQIADSRIVSAATPVDTPSFPDTKLFLGLAAVVAVGIGVALAFMMENYLGGFTSESQLASVLRLSSATGIPRQKVPPEDPKTGAGKSIADMVITAPFSMYAEAVRRLQVSIDQDLRHSGRDVAAEGLVLMVTSANAGEGKTTLALSLARAFALSGRSTILVDCDMRKPSVHTQLGMSPSGHLAEYLTTPEPDGALVRLQEKDPLSRVDIILGARSQDLSGSQVITGDTFGRLISEARKTHSIVILDTPPASVIVDALYLAGFADVIVALARYGKTSQHEARVMFEALANARVGHAPIIAALTAINRSARAGRRKYGQYYVES